MDRRSVRFFFAAVLLLAMASCHRKPQEEPVLPEAEPLPPLGFYTDRYDADTMKIRSGETFSGLMNRLGLGSRATYDMVQLCEPVFDVRKMRAGNVIQAYYSPDSTRTLSYVVYVQDRIRSFVFQCVDSLAVWSVDKPVSHEHKITDVTISSSLWNDMIASGGSPNLIMTLADIYQWSVNFFALQPGDRFRMIYDQSVVDGQVVGIDTVHFSLFNSAAGKEVAAVRFDTGEGGRSTYWDKGGESLKRMFLKAPLKYNRISSGFSYARRHPVTGVVKPHTAVDYAAPTGTPIQAVGDGTITKIGWDGSGGGNRIRIKHARGYETSYMHLSKFAPGLKAGSRVSQGQLIGYVGATGTATGPHLDFRVFENGKAIDPLSLNSPASEPLDPKYLSAFNALYERYIDELNGILPTVHVVPKAVDGD
ncbi:MAG: peptidoglycan DD-metalloendopeptidase family protein [Bacteroidales bacterium]|nr:peptidoglycan DD-metalloendopeptidase family protein [Bacteroidales bacterium]